MGFKKKTDSPAIPNNNSDLSMNQNHKNNNSVNNNHNNNHTNNINFLKVDDQTMTPDSPQLNIHRQAYSLPNFNARFRRSSQIPGARPKSMTSEKVLEKVTPDCKSPLELLKTLFPIVVWLSKYKKKDLVPDLVSGLTIAVFQVPESMGYSLLAHVNPVYCLYSSFFPMLIYSLMGTSRHCSVGTFAALAIMTGAIIRQVLADESLIKEIATDIELGNLTVESLRPTNADIAIVCSFVVGCYQLIFGFLRLGFVSVYMSEQFLNGFTCAVAYHVLGSQLKHMFGIRTKSESGIFCLTKAIIDVISNINETKICSLILSVTSIVILLTFKMYLNDLIKQKYKIKVPFPIEIFVVIGSVIVSNLLDLQNVYQIKVVGPIQKGLPTTVTPWRYWAVIKRVWALCIPLSWVSYAITYSVGKSFALKHEYEIDSSQEMIALGGSNLFSSFFQCIPVGASLSRSAVQESSGGRTQLVSLVNCVGIFAVILYFGSLLEQLPDAVLATIISVALRILLCEVKLFKQYWDVSKIDGSIWLVTFLSVIILDIDYGLYIGLIWSLLTLIYKSQRPRNHLLGTVGEQCDVFVPIGKYVNAREIPGIKIYQFCGPLHFANTDFFIEGLEQNIGFSPKEIKRKMAKIEKMKEKTATLAIDKQKNTYIIKKESIPKLPKHLIIDCTMFSYIDTDGIKTLKRCIADYGSVGIKTLLGGCASHVTKQLERDHFYAAVPAHHIYISVYDALQHAIAMREGIDGFNLVIEESSVDDNVGIVNDAYNSLDEIRIDCNENNNQKETQFNTA